MLHKRRIASQDPIYLLSLLDTMDSDDSDNNEFEGYLEESF